jgi:LacI family transcriptional regulator
MRQQRKVSSYDIARHAGVSQTTVSFVLNDRTDMPISAATREKVLASARELGYRPNRSARAIQSGRFGCIALLLSTVELRSILLPGLRDGILDALGERDIHLVLARLPDTALTDERYVPSILREWFADGLLVNYNSEVPDRMVRLIEENALPAVWVNLRREANCVYPDDEGMVRDATERLLSIGHRRIAYVNYTGVVHYSAADRIAGYRAGMAAAGFVPEVIESQHGILSMDEAHAILARPAEHRPTALVCYNDGMATRLMFAAVGGGRGGAGGAVG